MIYESSAKTDAGQDREINEDYFYVDNSKGVFIVCDGLGGHTAGEVASHKAVEFTLEYLCEHWTEVEHANQSPVGYYKLTQLVERAIHETCRKIREIADSDPNLDGMATTLTMLMIVDGNAIVGHVGDSRLYLKRKDEVYLLTTDHTIYSEMVSTYKDIDPTLIQKFSHCLTRSVGNDDSVAVETLMFEARQHDVLLLCTDGLSNYFPGEQEVAEVLSGNHVNVIADSLVQFANGCGGKDNITAIVIRILDVDDFELNTHRIRLDMSDTESGDTIE